MAYDLQDVVDHARRSLNDDDKVRWPDATLLEHAIGGLQIIRRRRPDVFVGQFTTDLTVLALVSDFPIDDDYREAVSEYVVSKAMFGEDESAVRTAAPTFYSMFERNA